MGLSDVTVEAVVELLVYRLTSVSAQLRDLAGGMEKDRADRIRNLAELLDWMARDAVMVKLRQEDLRNALSVARLEPSIHNSCE